MGGRLLGEAACGDSFGGHRDDRVASRVGSGGHERGGLVAVGDVGDVPIDSLDSAGDELSSRFDLVLCLLIPLGSFYFEVLSSILDVIVFRILTNIALLFPFQFVS